MEQGTRSAPTGKSVAYARRSLTIADLIGIADRALFWLHVQVAYVEGVVFDELAAGFDVLTH